MVGYLYFFIAFFLFFFNVSDFREELLVSKE